MILTFRRQKGAESAAAAKFTVPPWSSYETRLMSNSVPGIGSSWKARPAFIRWLAERWAQSRDRRIHPLLAEVSRVHRQLRGAWVGSGLLRWLGVWIWLGLGLSWFDYLTRPQETSLRFLLWSGWIIITLIMLFRWVIRRALAPLREVETALLLERHLPGLRHQLAAAVEFAQESQRSPSGLPKSCGNW